MKNKFITVINLSLAFLALFGCTGSPNSSVILDPNFNIYTQAQFSGIQEKDWNLISFFVDGRNSGFSRNTFILEGFEGFFTLHFDEERISGIGAPNRYFAPYTIEKSSSIKISVIASTLMAAFREPEKLKEHEYFNYLQHANKWSIEEENLVLYSVLENGTEVKLIFSEN